MPTERSRELDALRGLAVLMVVAGHAYLVGGVAPPHTSRALTDILITSGGAGIWLFFALSGFLIGAPFLRALRSGAPLPSPTRYARRRAARILPAYWIALAALLVLAPIANLAWWQVPLHAVLLHNLVPGEGQAVFFVAWTLGIEALFYVAVPLVAFAVRRARGPAAISTRALATGIAVLWLASIAYAIWAARAYPNTGPFTAVANADVVRLSLPGLLSAFCPGLLVAVLHDAGSPVLRAAQRRTALLLAAAATLAVAGALGYTASDTVLLDLSRQPWSLAAGALLVAALGGFGARPAGRKRAHAPHAAARSPHGGARAARRTAVALLARAGVISYGLYLWHYVVLKVLQRADVDVQAGALSWPLRITLLLALATPLAIASWVLVERPLLRRTRGARAAPYVER